MIGNLVFMQPWILTALVGLPLLWYLLRIMPPAPRIIRFPATGFLIGLIATEHTSRRTPWWILLLRLLMASIVIFAMARPVSNPAEKIAADGALRLVIDNGWASAQTWDLQTKAANEALTQAGREKREIYILTTAPAPGEKKPVQYGPLSYGEASSTLRGLFPLPWPADNRAAKDLIVQSREPKTIASLWLSNGLDEGGVLALAEELQKQGSLSYFAPATSQLPLLLRPAKHTTDTRVHIAVDAPYDIPSGFPATIVAQGKSGEIIDIRTLALDPNKAPMNITFDIPPAQQNNIARFRLSSHTGAGGIFLLDEQSAKRTVGIVAPAGKEEISPLTEPAYYIRRALEPFTILKLGDTEEILKQSPSMIILPDIAAMPTDTLNRLEQWIKDGGLLLRFCGPNMSEAQGAQYLIPVNLRTGERSLEGSLSWNEPQTIAPFTQDSPLYGLEVPEDIHIRQQLLADPGQDLEGKIWARLTDGTPLITAASLEQGLLVLVHTTAGPEWSDLALSGLYLEILKRLVTLAGQTEKTVNANHEYLEPLLILDGKGNLVPPQSFVQPLPAKDFNEIIPDSTHPPGIYGTGGFQYALNLGTSLPTLKTIKHMPSGVIRLLYDTSYEHDLMPGLLVLAAILFLIDWIIMILLAVGLHIRLKTIATGIIFLNLFSPQPVRAEDTINDLRYANGFYLAYIQTGDTNVDITAQHGLEDLANTLRQRTSVEPDGVVGLDAETSNLAFFPLIYWPITPNQKQLTGKALQNIQYYLDHGGTILFDTRDQNRSTSRTSGTVNAKVLQNITASLNIPPLAPIPKKHVLSQTFYLLKSFPGYYDGGTIWVEQESNPGRDGVSSVIIGGHDWAAAWANQSQQSFTGPASKQELATRFGVNLVMYALTGNYKTDQVHVPHILRRLDN